jgi:hypothetical protein
MQICMAFLGVGRELSLLRTVIQLLNIILMMGVTLNVVYCLFFAGLQLHKFLGF